MSVFALVESKGGHKLKQSEDGDGQIQSVRGKFALTGHHATLYELAMFLSDPLRTPVVDMTGLKGGYDFTFDITEFIPRERVSGEQPPDSVGIMQMALPKQLGLKLEARKLPIDRLVIDHVEKIPSEN